MDLQDIASIERDSRVIFDELNVAWEWEERLTVVLMTYSKDKNDEVIALLERVFSSSWTTQTLPTAPDDIRALVSNAAGLQAGQKFLHSEPGKPVILFAAVWPWGNGQTVSLRIGCYTPALTEEQRGEVQGKLRGWFGIA